MVYVLVLGIVALLVDTHYVKSNRESGYGRFDIVLIPRDKKLQGIILEFKETDKTDNLQSKAQEALKQIENTKYEIELLDMGIKEIYKYRIAFSGKKIEIAEVNAVKSVNKRILNEKSIEFIKEFIAPAILKRMDTDEKENAIYSELIRGRSYYIPQLLKANLITQEGAEELKTLN